jgi:signal peptidase I
VFPPVRGAGLIALLTAAAVVAGCGGAGGTTNNTTVIVGTPATGTTRAYRVPSGSMEPTYSVGENVLVQSGAPAVGRVVVFHPPEGAEESRCGEPQHPMTAGCDTANPEPDASTRFIKRVVAGPGDSIYIKEGHVYRKPAGQSTYAREADSYIRACAPSVGVICNLTTPITVPAGSWYLLGDNRGESDDSRFWGPVPTAWIVGVAVGAE